jgi:hypothetical protein
VRGRRPQARRAALEEVMDTDYNRLFWIAMAVGVALVIIFIAISV